MSARMSALLASRICSGAMKSGVPRIWPSAVRPRVDLLLAGRLGQAEVEYLDRRLVPLPREHQVARLDVAVDEPFLMGVLEPEGRLIDEVCWRARPAAGPWP